MEQEISTKLVDDIFTKILSDVEEAEKRALSTRKLAESVAAGSLRLAKKYIVTADITTRCLFAALDKGNNLFRLLIRRLQKQSSLEERLKIINSETCGMTLLVSAILEGNIKAVSLLLEAGANPFLGYKRISPKTGCLTSLTPAALALTSMHDEILEKLLVFAPAIIHRVTPTGNTLLHTAVNSQKNKNGALDNKIKTIIILLVRKGVQLNKQNDMGFTALGLAALIGNIELLQLLINLSIEYSQDLGINLQNALGWTPLNQAIEQRKINIVRVLMGLGANLHLKDKLGWDALEWAKYFADKDATKSKEADEILKLIAETYPLQDTSTIRPQVENLKVSENLRNAFIEFMESRNVPLSCFDQHVDNNSVVVPIRIAVQLENIPLFQLLLQLGVNTKHLNDIEYLLACQGNPELYEVYLRTPFKGKDIKGLMILTQSFPYADVVLCYGTSQVKHAMSRNNGYAYVLFNQLLQFYPQHGACKKGAFYRYVELSNKILEFHKSMPAENSKKRLFIYGENHCSKSCLSAELFYMYALYLKNVKTIYHEFRPVSLKRLQSNLYLKDTFFRDFTNAPYIVKFAHFLGCQLEAMDLGYDICVEKNIDHQCAEGMNIRDQEMANYINPRSTNDAMIICGASHVASLVDRIDKELFSICILPSIENRMIIPELGLDSFELYAPEEIVGIHQLLKVYTDERATHSQMSSRPVDDSWCTEILPLTQTLQTLFSPNAPIKIVVTILDYLFALPSALVDDKEEETSHPTSSETGLQFAWEGYRTRSDHKFEDQLQKKLIKMK